MDLCESLGRDREAAPQQHLAPEQRKSCAEYRIHLKASSDGPNRSSQYAKISGYGFVQLHQVLLSLQPDGLWATFSSRRLLKLLHE